MKRSYLPIILIILSFAVIFAGFNIFYNGYLSGREMGRTVTVNRINDEIASSSEDPAVFINRSRASFENEFGKDLPSIAFIPLTDISEDDTFVDITSDGSVICTLVRDGELIGFVRYTYPDRMTSGVRTGVNITILLCAAVALIYAVYINRRILSPFKKLSEYPERLAKMPDADQLPENRNRSFGKFIWSMNMLRDVLGKERKRTEKLECERQTLVASIAHSVKTPVMNIRLYAEALKSGLILPNGQKADISEIADNIDRNAERIQKLAAEVITASSTAVSAYEPEIEEFYLKDLAAMVEDEYASRMELARIPFSVGCDGNPLVQSDRYGILRIISLLIDNAIKYGSGKGITVSMMKEDEGITVSVTNKGELLPEEELSFIFTSFRRGSNSAGKEGSGIGLFTARSISNALGGNIFARRLEDKGEMEFTFYIPL